MSWFWLALAAPILWGAVNHIDKYIISKYFTGKGVGSLVIFTGLSGFIISFLILVFNFSSIFLSPVTALVIAINGAILVAAFIPYLYALEKEEASWVSPLYQLIPVFGYFLGMIFLKEYLSLNQIIGSILIIVGAFALSLNITSKLQFKIRPFLLMVLSSFMIAVNALIFKIIALQENFWGTAFWEYLGGFIFAIFLFTSVSLYHKQFLATIEKSQGLVLSLNIFSELMNIVAKLLAGFASLLAPLALVWVVNGFQPVIVLIYGIILTLFIPKWGKENLDRKFLTQKIVAILITFLGAYILFS
ncbi:MAG: EamA family transporter [Candidatus Buchananbacteria bacterium]|nr:EamA family transporter [Candidatus Buchananbacteria bacterium]